MPDRPLTIAAYAAGASLAAISLFYVFGPTYLLDGEESSVLWSSRKKGVVGLVNPANDCFINSILQALAGISDLRVYLIREIHRRKLDGSKLYQLDDMSDIPEVYKDQPWKLDGLQQGMVTVALKEILDSLNERPIYKKTISAKGFIRALEQAFRTRISMQQQDAQEFLQLVAERLCDEYHAGSAVRQKFKDARIKRSCMPPSDTVQEEEDDEILLQSSETTATPVAAPDGLDQNAVGNVEEIEQAAENGFPFEGELESQVECMTCHFKPKPSRSSFVTLTLHVPHQSATTLSTCFDGMLKVEKIDDYRCDRCRLDHALTFKRRELARARSTEDRRTLESDVAKLEAALRTDPEKAPEGVILPDADMAPRRLIHKHTRISRFPNVVAIHLSRSIFDPGSTSVKNMAKVSFPERLPLGGILDRKTYKLLSIVCHKGGHHSGHYETFRRQHVPQPFSNSTAFSGTGVYSSPMSVGPASTAPSPQLSPEQIVGESRLSTSLHATEKFSRNATSDPASSKPSTPNPASSQESSERVTGTLTNDAPPSGTQPAVLRSPSKRAAVAERLKRKPHSKGNDRWWRISDDKVSESKTKDVVDMQREVYLLFYELERPANGRTFG